MKFVFASTIAVAIAFQAPPEPELGGSEQMEICYQVKDEACADCIYLSPDLNFCHATDVSTCFFTGTCTGNSCDCGVIIYVEDDTHKKAYQTSGIGKDNWSINVNDATLCATLDACKELCHLGQCESENDPNDPVVVWKCNNAVLTGNLCPKNL